MLRFYILRFRVSIWYYQGERLGVRFIGLLWIATQANRGNVGKKPTHRTIENEFGV